MSTIKLINTRGRIVNIEEKDVPSFLKQGWLLAPVDLSGEYSNVYDKGELEHALPPIPIEVHKHTLVTPKLGDILTVEVI